VKPLSLIRDAVRARQILTVLVRYGFSNLLEQVNAPTGWITKVVRREEVPYDLWQRIRMVCEDLGPTAVKMGQILSTQPDIIPAPLVEEFKKLQSHVKPFPFEKIRKVLEQELKGKIDDYFDIIVEKPIGSGSIAQVHKARLKENGEWVALKIQRPGIEKALKTDLEILSWLSREIHERVSDMHAYDLPGVVQTLRKSLLRETDFTIEANNSKIFANSNPYEDVVFSPEVLDEFTTERLLVTEYIEGTRADKVTHLSDEERISLAHHGGVSVFHQIIIKGFFHADPHPGNIIVTPDKRICLIDWGMTGQLTRHMRYHLADMLSALKSQDAERITRVALAMSHNQKKVDSQQVEMEINQILHKYPSLDVGKIGRVILDLINILGQNGIQLSRDYTLLAKSILSIEQTGHALDHEFDIGKVAKPFLEQLTMERINPIGRWKELLWNLHNGIFKLNALPGDISRLIRRIENEEVSVNLHHTGLNRLMDTINSSSNRLTLAIIIGALIIGSSMIITTGVAPLILGYPALGIIGYLMSFFLGVWIVFDILRHGRHK
jgi:ubiquinone biosynthesis protein